MPRAPRSRKARAVSAESGSGVARLVPSGNGGASTSEESDAFQPGSYWVYEVTPRPDGGSRVHMEFDRRPANLKGHVLSALFRVAGRHGLREVAERDAQAHRVFTLVEGSSPDA